MEAIGTKTFSPKEFSQVVGVSESSIKRWVDDGRIDVMRTAGGHRRIMLTEALRFIRSQGMHVLRPDMLGLPDLSNLPVEAREGDFTGDTLFHLLKNGEASKVRGIIAQEFLSGMSVAALFDGPMAEALEALGRLWEHGEEGIYIEHMATHICIEAINQLRMLIPEARDGAPVALGGAISNDPFIIPSLMASTVLAEAGYAEINLGPDTPHAAILHAVEAHQPALVWLSLTSPLEEEQVEGLIQQLLFLLDAQAIDVILGGQQAVTLRDVWPDFVHVMASMEDLAAYASSLHQG